MQEKQIELSNLDNLVKSAMQMKSIQPRLESMVSLTKSEQKALESISNKLNKLVMKELKIKKEDLEE
jgi:hypothetical protein